MCKDWFLVLLKSDDYIFETDEIFFFEFLKYFNIQIIFALETVSIIHM